jgi:predicted Zn-dependent peptidase
MKRKLFSDINAYISGDMDKGLFTVTGRLIKGITMDVAEKAINEELKKIQKNIEVSELEKVKNKIEATLIFSEMNVLNKAMNIAYNELLGNADLINTEIDRYRAVSVEMIKEQAHNIFREENCSTLYYNAIK